MRPNSPQVIECQASPRQARNIVLSGHFRTRPNIIEARFGHVGSLCTYPPIPDRSSCGLPFDVCLS
jgi:hypothetical protein